MALIYRTTGAWGAGKGSPLTSVEGDANIYQLLQRIVALEDNPPAAVSISSITQSDDTILVHMSDGSTFGPFTLPTASFNDRGDWEQDKQYYKNDIVHVPAVGVFKLNYDFLTDPTDPFDPDQTDGLGHRVYLKIMKEETLAYIYDIGFYYPSRPGQGIDTGGNIFSHIVTEAMYLPISLTGSYAKLATAPAAALVFPLLKNATSIGSVNFALGATTATFTFAADVSFAAGDVLRVGRPTAIDTAAQELSLTFNGTRGTP